MNEKETNENNCVVLALMPCTPQSAPSSSPTLAPSAAPTSSPSSAPAPSPAPASAAAPPATAVPQPGAHAGLDPARSEPPAVPGACRAGCLLHACLVACLQLSPRLCPRAPPQPRAPCPWPLAAYTAKVSEAERSVSVTLSLGRLRGPLPEAPCPAADDLGWRQGVLLDVSEHALRLTPATDAARVRGFVLFGALLAQARGR